MSLKRLTPHYAAVCLLALGSAALRTEPGRAAAPTLTSEDYVAIQQLVATYPYAVDNAVENGNLYASLFSPTGVFVQRTGDVRGSDALAAVARRFQRGPQSTFHFLLNHAIEPSPEGAVGKEYLAQLAFDKGQPSSVYGGGHYDDVYEKTAKGWRFKRRQFIPSESGPTPSIPTAAIGPMPRIATGKSKANTLTAADYLEIQQLIARYPYGLDTGAQGGKLYADVFTADGLFFAGSNNRQSGRDQLVAFANGHRPGSGPSYTRNFDGNVMIWPSAEGAIGRVTALVTDIGEGAGKPSKLLNGGHYNDLYVRTPEGWRIKQRQFVPSRSGQQATETTAPKVPVAVTPDSGSKPRQGQLSPGDYIEIQQLVAGYPVAMDTGADSGYMYADLFTADGKFIVGTKTFEGRENLKKFAWQHRPGQGLDYVRNLSTNIRIEPSAGGATGQVFAAIFDLGEGGKLTTLLDGGHYEDVYVKTPVGWRIKQREFIYSKVERPARTQTRATQ